MLTRALTFTLLFATAAAAQQPAREDLAKSQAEKIVREQQKQASIKDAAAARREIQDLTAELSTLTAAQGKETLVAGAGRSRLEALNAREAELKVRVWANQNELARLLGALQMFSKSPPPALFVHPKDAKSAVRAAILIRAVTPALKSRADVLAKEAAQAKRVRRDAASQAGELFTAESAIADRAGRIEVLIAERQALERQLYGDIALADRDIAALSARVDSLQQVVARLPAQPAPNVRFTRLFSPVSGAPVRKFGEADGRGGKSQGLSWRPGAGSRVVAPATGVVEFAGPVSGWKSVLILRLSDDYHLVLAGLDVIATAPGQSVAAGQLIGSMAQKSVLTPATDAPELVLELRKGGQPVDPARFLPQ